MKYPVRVLLPTAGLLMWGVFFLVVAMSTPSPIAFSIEREAPVVSGREHHPAQLTPHQDRADASQPVAKTECINVNTATADELATLPGLGPVIAQRVTDHRLEHGAYAAPIDLMRVQGIGAGRLKKIAQLICF